MKGQVFTLDLVLGAVIVLSIVTGAYALSSYYLTLNQSFISNGATSGEFTSAVTAFNLVNSTRNQLLLLQNGGSQSAFSTYMQKTLGKELDFPFSIKIYALENYSASVPNIIIFNYTSSTFSSNTSSSEAFNNPVFVTNASSLCGSSCNYSLNATATFPGENVTIFSPTCNIYTNKGAAAGWTVYNNTPTGYCTLKVGTYITTGLPNNYLVKGHASVGGASLGNETVFVLGIDVISIKVG